MQSILLNSRVGHDGILKLNVPVGFQDAELEVVIVVQPITSSQGLTDASGWPSGFFEQTFGCLRDDPIIRESQGEYEIRVELQ